MSSAPFVMLSAPFATSSALLEMSYVPSVMWFAPSLMLLAQRLRSFVHLGMLFVPIDVSSVQMEASFDHVKVMFVLQMWSRHHLLLCFVFVSSLWNIQWLAGVLSAHLKIVEYCKYLNNKLVWRCVLNPIFISTLVYPIDRRMRVSARSLLSPSRSSAGRLRCRYRCHTVHSQHCSVARSKASCRNPQHFLKD